MAGDHGVQGGYYRNHGSFTLADRLYSSVHGPGVRQVQQYVLLCVVFAET